MHFRICTYMTSIATNLKCVIYLKVSKKEFLEAQISDLTKIILIHFLKAIAPYLYLPYRLNQICPGIQQYQVSRNASFTVTSSMWRIKLYRENLLQNNNIVIPSTPTFHHLVLDLVM